MADAYERRTGSMCIDLVQSQYWIRLQQHFLFFKYVFMDFPQCSKTDLTVTLWTDGLLFCSVFLYVLGNCRRSLTVQRLLCDIMSICFTSLFSMEEKQTSLYLSLFFQFSKVQYMQTFHAATFGRITSIPDPYCWYNNCPLEIMEKIM